MTTTPFLIDDEIREKFKVLVAHAEKNPLSMDDLEDMAKGKRTVVGDLSDFSAYLPFGYKVVLSIEHQTGGKVRHFSMSINKKNALPDPNTLQICMTLLGFKTSLFECMVDLEPIKPGYQAVNVLELIK